MDFVIPEEYRMMQTTIEKTGRPGHPAQIGWT